MSMPGTCHTTLRLLGDWKARCFAVCAGRTTLLKMASHQPKGMDWFSSLCAWTCFATFPSSLRFPKLIISLSYLFFSVVYLLFWKMGCHNNAPAVGSVAPSTTAPVPVSYEMIHQLATTCFSRLSHYCHLCVARCAHFSYHAVTETPILWYWL